MSKLRISVFGMGYVGAVSAACLSRDGHDVIGVDIDRHKLDLLRSGRAPIVEEGIQDLTKSAVDSGRLTVTDDALTAIQGSDIAFVCVGTPSSPNGSQNQGAILAVAEQIGSALRDLDRFHCVVIRSTVEPGTTEGRIKAALEDASGKVAGKDFGVCFQPEFLREGSSIQDYDNPPFTVVGTNSEVAAELLEKMFGHLPCEFIVTDIGSAELLKYACNSFHAIKITFANEIGRISRAYGVDSRRVMDLVCRDTSLNISPAYLRPGFAFGGSCLPKDLRALNYLARMSDVQAPMLDSVLASNLSHIDEAVSAVLNTGARSVGLIGLSFKTGTDDLRESPLVDMAERFIGKGLELRIYDPQVNLSMLIGANKKYIEHHIPHIAGLLVDDPVVGIENADAIVIGSALPEALSAVKASATSDQLILDLVGKLEPSAVRGNYQGICW